MSDYSEHDPLGQLHDEGPTDVRPTVPAQRAPSEPVPPEPDQFALARTARPPALERAVARVDITRQRRHLLAGAERAHRVQARSTMTVRVVGLGYTGIRSVEQRHHELGEQLLAERRDGATVHERLFWLWRLVPPLVALVDLLVLHRFCADLFNVLPGDTGPDGLAALGLAILGSGVAYTWLALTGTRLRSFRLPLGQIAWRVLGVAEYLLLAIGVLLAATMGMLMYERILGRAAYAGAYLTPGQGATIALAFAVLSVCANLAVVAVHAYDGSHLLAEHRALGRCLSRRSRRLERGRRGMNRQFRRAGLIDVAAVETTDSPRVQQEPPAR